METLEVGGVRFDTWAAQILNPTAPLPPSVACPSSESSSAPDTAPSRDTCKDTVCAACAERGETTCRGKYDAFTVPACACESNGAFWYCDAPPVFG